MSFPLAQHNEIREVYKEMHVVEEHFIHFVWPNNITRTAACYVKISFVFQPICAQHFFIFFGYVQNGKQDAWANLQNLFRSSTTALPTQPSDTISNSFYPCLTPHHQAEVLTTWTVLWQRVRMVEWIRCLLGQNWTTIQCRQLIPIRACLQIADHQAPSHYYQYNNSSTSKP